MLKRLCCLILCLSLVTGLAACSQNEGKVKNPTGAVSSEGTNSENSESAQNSEDTNNSEVSSQGQDEENYTDDQIGNDWEDDDFSEDNGDNDTSGDANVSGTVSRRPDKPTIGTAEEESYTVPLKYRLEGAAPLSKTYTSKYSGKTYNLVWQDEFSGTKVDYNKWGYGTQSGGGNPNCATLTDRDDKSIVQVKNGTLQMHSRRYFDVNNKNIKYAIPKSPNTQNQMNFIYGYVEMRAKVPLRESGFPALWCIGKPSLVKKRETGYYVEIDIFESLCSRIYNTRLDSNFHKWYDNGTSTNFSPYVAEQTHSDSVYSAYDLVAKGESKYVHEEYHLYSMEWTPERLTTFFDGKMICSIDLTVSWDKDVIYPNGNGKGTGKTLPEGKKDMKGYHDYIYLILQNIIFCADDADGDKIVQNNTKFPFEYYVDYIRLYQDPTNKKGGKTLNGLVYLDDNGKVVNKYPDRVYWED